MIILVKKEFWSLHLPRKTYRDGVCYYGTFPEGFIKKVNSLGIINGHGPIVNLCSGMSEFGDIRIDINPQSNATKICDARDTGLPDNYAQFVLLDPYYSKEDFDKMGQQYISAYPFLKEAYRICKVGGYIGVLHNRPPRKPKGTEYTHVIAISMGPDRLLRCFLIFRKLEVN